MGNCDCSVARPDNDGLRPCFPDRSSKLSRIRDSRGSGDDLSEESTASGNHHVSSPLRKSLLKRNEDKRLTWNPNDPDSDNNETEEEPDCLQSNRQRPRKGACCAESFQRGGYFREPFWNKTGPQKVKLFEALRSLVVFKRYKDQHLRQLVNAVEIHRRIAGAAENEVLAEKGEVADGLFVVLSGAVVYSDERGARRGVYPEGSVIDEVAVLWGAKRKWTMKAEGECTFGKLRRDDCINLGTRLEHKQREWRQMLLQRNKLLEVMDLESISKLADVLTTRTYEPGEAVIQQGEEGKEFFIVTAGEARAYMTTAKAEQECMKYQEGGLFGEKALIKNQTRMATVRAITKLEVMILTRRQFERLFGSMQDMQDQQYLTDPRRLLADFYAAGDSRGPRGTLQLRQLKPEPEAPQSTWFAVYRPTSTAAIALMLSGVAVGKGLNVKGKSAKQGNLSGFVPFVQISDNEHKKQIEDSPPESRLTVYYRTRSNRDEARKALTKALPDVQGAVRDPRIDDEDSYIEEGAPTSVYGLSLPEKLLREVYIMRQDLEPVLGWETGRRSEPFNMDANLHAIREDESPKVVLYQHDEGEPMNPRGLLVAYAEKFVKPVVSDFDTFTVGSRGMMYKELARDQAEIVRWLLDRVRSVLDSRRDGTDWTKRWMKILKEEGFHHPVPKLGFGDPTSLTLTEEVVQQTISVGAVRHGAECCNFKFPQELDDEYLVVWHGYQQAEGKPWHYLREGQLREFLIERAREGYSFPLNPVWPLRDDGWYEVLRELRNQPAAEAALQAWFPPEYGFLEAIDQIHEIHPQGFQSFQPEMPTVKLLESADS